MPYLEQTPETEGKGMASCLQFEGTLTLKPLRPRQELAISNIRQAIREGHKRIVLQAPTGSGKTVIAAHIISAALAKGNRPLFTVPQLSLIEQTVQRFEAQGISDIGVIQAQHERTDWNAAVQVASVQTLVRRMLPEVDVVMIDEVHIRYAALNKILDSEAWAKKIVIGLSATPWAKGMGLRWTKLITFGTTQELISEGWLTPVEAYGVPDDFEPDKTKVSVNFDGEYVEKEAEAAMSTQKIVGNVVKNWQEKGPGEKTFMFCVNRAHAQRMQKEFQDAGVGCGYIDGNCTREEREETFRKYRSGEYKIISSVGCLVVGIDEDVRCIIFLCLTRSEIKLVQAAGRGIRLADGKERLLFFDHSGSIGEEALPMFTDIHHAELDKRKPGDKSDPTQAAPKPSKCPKCFALIPAGRSVCPMCGEHLKAKDKVRAVQGELVAITGKKKEPKATMVDKQQFYSELLGLARERGYNEGWCAHRFRERFSTWPACLQKVAIMPTQKVRKFDQDRRSEFYKAKEAQDAALSWELR